MNKTYISPTIIAVSLVGNRHLLESSMKVDGSTPVENSSDIGFAKEEKVQPGSVWDDDWDD